MGELLGTYITWESVLYAGGGYDNLDVNSIALLPLDERGQGETDVPRRQKNWETKEKSSFFDINNSPYYLKPVVSLLRFFFPTFLSVQTDVQQQFP